MALTNGEAVQITLNVGNFSLLDAGDSPHRVSDGAGSLPTFLLLHLVSLVGQMALQQVVYLEVSVSAELRRRRILKEEKTKKQSDTNTKKQRPQVRTKGFFLWAALLGSQVHQTSGECSPEVA